jgi:hypothetical protein
MRLHLGDGYAASFAHDHVLPQLGGRTVDEALESGEDTKTVWRAVADALELPRSER